MWAPEIMAEPKKIAEHEEVFASMPDIRINGPLLVSGSDCARDPLERKPASSESSLGNYHSHGLKPQSSSSQTVSQIETATMEEGFGDQVKFDGGIRYVNDGQDKVTLAIKAWPTSPSTMNNWSSSVALEISLYILMAIGAVIFLSKE
jgi:hypothetical protein